MDEAAAASDLISRFGALIDRIKQAVAENAGRDTRRLGALSVLLWGYLGRALQRLAALETRRAAGTLPQHAPTARKAGRDRTVASGASPAALAARIPHGPVLLQFHAAHLAWALERLIETPEMQALLEAAPQAGRVLRPLWRMLNSDPPPPPLRLPPRTRRARKAIRPNPSADEAEPAPRRGGRVSAARRGGWWEGAPAAPPLVPAPAPAPLRPIAAPRPPPPDW